MYGWLVLLTSLSISIAGAGEGGREPHGPGELPIPFQSANQKVELSDGELYTLLGWVRIKEGRGFFEVDFAAHPWLANTRRKALPFYPLVIDKGGILPYEDQRVQVFVQAQGGVEYGTEGAEPAYTITLVSQIDPVIQSDGRPVDRK